MNTVEEKLSKLAAYGLSEEMLKKSEILLKAPEKSFGAMERGFNAVEKLEKACEYINELPNLKTFQAKNETLKVIHEKIGGAMWFMGD